MNRALDELAALVSDGLQIDWDEAETLLSNGELANLRIVERVARFHRQSPVPSGERQPGWAHLEIRQKIGQGSFGEVYRAWDPTLEREVALKLLRPRGRGADELKSAILREGRLLAKIRHANVVVVHGVAEHRGAIGLWMELALGRALAEIVADSGPLGPLEAAAIGIELCRALAAVHSAGLIHRDIKAENIVREKGGRILLVDFGLGLARHELESSGVVGTPLYLAPEVVLKESPPSVQSDIYALGVLLFFLVTGSFPVRAHNMSSLKDAHRQGMPRTLLDARPDLPSNFIAATQRALNRTPSRRFESAGQLEQQLAAIASSSTGGVSRKDTTVRKPVSGRFYRLALGLAVFLVLLTGMLEPEWARDLGLSSWLPTVLEDGTDSQALPLYKLGRHYLERRTEGDIRKAMSYFEQTIQKDKGFAPAYSGLADCYSTLADYGAIEYKSGAEAVDWANRALNLDNDLAEAHASYGLATTLFRRSWKEAERSFKRAIDLDPEYALAYQWHAALLAKTGRTQEAVDKILEGLNHDPASASLNTVAGWMKMLARDYQGALEFARKARDLESGYHYDGLLEARLLALQGDFEGAREVAEEEKADTHFSFVVRACIEGAAGNDQKALEYVGKLKARRENDHFAATHLATVYAILDMKDEAFDWLRKADREGDVSIQLLKVHPYYDNLRDDPRYHELLKKLGLDDRNLGK